MVQVIKFGTLDIEAGGLPTDHITCFYGGIQMGDMVTIFTKNCDLTF